MSDTIIPQIKLLIAYDVLPGVQESYHRFILGEFVPTAESLGLYMREAWHTAYGDYPSRLSTLVAEDLETLLTILDSEEWHSLEETLKSYTTNYSTKVVRFRHRFQFQP